MLKIIFFYIIYHHSNAYYTMRAVIFILIVSCCLSQCPNDQDCTLTCSNKKPCRNVKCPEKGFCSVSCIGESSCNNLVVKQESKQQGNLRLTCAGSDKACQSAVVNCPKNGECIVSCAYNSIGSCHNVTVRTESKLIETCVNKENCTIVQHPETVPTTAPLDVKNSVMLMTEDGFVLIYFIQSKQIIHLEFYGIVTGIYAQKGTFNTSAPGCVLFDATKVSGGGIIIVWTTTDTRNRQLFSLTKQAKFGPVRTDTNIKSDKVVVLPRKSGTGSYIVLYVTDNAKVLRGVGYDGEGAVIIPDKLIGRSTSDIESINAAMLDDGSYAFVSYSPQSTLGYPISSDLDVDLAISPLYFQPGMILSDITVIYNSDSDKHICATLLSKQQTDVLVQCINAVSGKRSSTATVFSTAINTIDRVTVLQLRDRSMVYLYFEFGILYMRYVNSLFQTVNSATAVDFVKSFYVVQLLTGGTEFVMIADDKTHLNQISNKVFVSPVVISDSGIIADSPPIGENESPISPDVPSASPGSLPLVNEIIFILLMLASLLTSSASTSPAVQIVTVVANTWDCVRGDDVTFNSKHIYRGVGITSISESDSAGYVVFNIAFCIVVGLFLYLTERFFKNKVPNIRYPSSMLLAPVLLYFGTLRSSFQIIGREGAGFVLVSIFGIVVCLAVVYAIKVCGDICAREAKLIQLSRIDRIRKYIFGDKQWNSSCDTLSSYGVFFDSYACEKGIFRNGRFLIFELIILTSLCLVSSLNLKSYDGCLIKSVISAFLIGILCIAHVSTYPFISPLLNELSLATQVLALVAMGCFGYGFSFRDVNGSTHQIGFICVYVSLSLCSVRILLQMFVSVRMRLTVTSVGIPPNAIPLVEMTLTSPMSEKETISIFKPPTETDSVGIYKYSSIDPSESSPGTKPTTNSSSMTKPSKCSALSSNNISIESNVSPSGRPANIISESDCVELYNYGAFDAAELAE